MRPFADWILANPWLIVVAFFGLLFVMFALASAADADDTTPEVDMDTRIARAIDDARKADAT